MNAHYNSTILKDLHDISLRMALRTIDNYTAFKNKSFVSDRLKEREFIISYLDGMLYFLRDHRKITPTFKYNVFSLLNDIRFNYSFSNYEEKSYINKRINEIIILVNSCSVFDDEEASLLREEELMIANTFYIVHYYLTDDETYKKEGIPFIQEIEYYGDSIYFLLKLYPSLLQDNLFLKRTYMLLNPDIKETKEKEEKHIKKLKKNLTKELRRR